MLEKKKEHPKEKTELHPRNKHRGRYDLKELVKTLPELANFVFINPYNDESIDFFNPEAVKALNKALLMHYYGIKHWDIPENYLCPPIPGRADYIHYCADLLSFINEGEIPTGATVKCLDIGVGANCVYPIVGIKEYGWSFVGSETDAISVKSANNIIKKNPSLKGKVDIRLQANPDKIFDGIIQEGEVFDISICNPPFHASLADAQAGTIRKLSNLKNQRIDSPILNFGGQGSELWCDGGEELFVERMIWESKHYAKSCKWFTTIISKQNNLKSVYYHLEKAEATEIKTVKFGQGNKVSRIVAWSFD